MKTQERQGPTGGGGGEEGTKGRESVKARGTERKRGPHRPLKSMGRASLFPTCGHCRTKTRSVPSMDSRRLEGSCPSATLRLPSSSIERPNSCTT